MHTFYRNSQESGARRKKYTYHNDKIITVHSDFEFCHSVLLKLRKKGILGYFTMDAGPNVHVICEKEHKDILEKKFKNYPGVEFIITSKVCDGAKTIDEHLF